MFLFSTRPSFARSTVPTDTALTAPDASSSMTCRRPMWAPSNRLWLLACRTLRLPLTKISHYLRWTSTQLRSFQTKHKGPNRNLRKFKSLSNHKRQLPRRLAPEVSATSRLRTLSLRKRSSTETSWFTVSTIVSRSTRRRPKCFKRKWLRKSIWTTFSCQKSTTWTYILLKFRAWRYFKKSPQTSPLLPKIINTTPTSKEVTSMEMLLPTSSS